MKSLKIIGFTKDLRTNTHVVYAQICVNDYLKLVGDNYDRFQLQRKREQHKGYARLKEDLSKGALIPTITLAVEPQIASNYIDLIVNRNIEELVAKIISEIQNNLYILDGLQRTHKIKELQEAGVEFSDEQILLLEIWFEGNIDHLVYRLIVLNSGQKPMSMRHQIELLFTAMRVTLSTQIPNLEILVENDDEKRVRPKQIPFDRLVTSYRCFLTGSPEVDKDSLVSEKLLEEKILEQNEEFLSASFSGFRDFFVKFLELDSELFRICIGTDLNLFRNWLADANTMNSFFAAIGKLHETRAERIYISISILLKMLQISPKGEDVLGLMEYKKIREEVADPKLFNVGFATRKLLTDSFYEFFRDEGNTSLLNCWVRESINMKNLKAK